MQKQSQTNQLSEQEEKHIGQQVAKYVDKILSKHVISKAEFLQQQFKQHTSTATIAAFSFLIALAWKDLIVNLVETIIKKDLLTQVPYLSDLITAIVITIIAIVGIAIVTRWANKTASVTSAIQNN